MISLAALPFRAGLPGGRRRRRRRRPRATASHLADRASRCGCCMSASCGCADPPELACPASAGITGARVQARGDGPPGGTARTRAYDCVRHRARVGENVQDAKIEPRNDLPDRSEHGPVPVPPATEGRDDARSGRARCPSDARAGQGRCAGQSSPGRARDGAGVRRPYGRTAEVSLLTWPGVNIVEPEPNKIYADSRLGPMKTATWLAVRVTQFALLVRPGGLLIHGLLRYLSASDVSNPHLS